MTGDSTVKTICHWLAERSPSTSIIDLLTKVWAICNPALSTSALRDQTVHIGTTDVCQEILGNNVSEKCMCGQPIALKEVRFRPLPSWTRVATLLRDL